MKKPFKILITGQIFNACLYTFIYVCSVFYYWEFFNPFAWILTIPKWHPDQRGGLLTFFLFYNGFIYLLINGFFTDPKKKPETNNPQ